MSTSKDELRNSLIDKVFGSSNPLPLSNSASAGTSIVDIAKRKVINEEDQRMKLDVVQTKLFSLLEEVGYKRNQVIDVVANFMDNLNRC